MPLGSAKGFAYWRKNVFCLVLCFAAVLTAPRINAGEWNQELFPVPERMKARVEFWKKIYTEVPSTEALFHDSEDVTLIYGKMRLPDSQGRARRKLVKAQKALWRERLLRAAQGKGVDPAFGAELQARLAALPPARLREMASDVRHQQGMSDRYVEGLKRSYLYLAEIQDVFKSMGLPVELSFLPHVESSFNYLAYSKVGAAGIWQFMRSTGRLYGLKQTYLIDERRDPLIATRAAARLLRDNYQKLGSWPLALTAYNHGAASMERAVRKLGTREIDRILEDYDGRRFGFASKNFYATFVAAAQISTEPEKYFSSLEAPVLKRLAFATLKLQKPMTLAQVTQATGVGRDALEDLNLALRPILFRSRIALPSGYVLRLPQAGDDQVNGWKDRLAAVEPPPQPAGGETEHKVSPGESLYVISKIYGVSVQDLIVLNEIDRPSRVIPGMRLKIPGAGGVKASPLKAIVAAVVPKKLRQKLQKEPKVVAPVPLMLLAAANAPAPKTVVPAPAPSSEVAVGGIKGGFQMEAYDLDAEEVEHGIYRIHVESDETLGHYADWAAININRIRATNGLKPKHQIRLGQRLKLPLRESQLVKFNSRRVQYHAELEEDFYSSYAVSELEDYTVARGDAVESLCRAHDIPIWLLKKYQKPGALENLVVGTVLKIPRVVSSGRSEQKEPVLPLAPAAGDGEKEPGASADDSEDAP